MTRPIVEKQTSVIQSEHERFRERLALWERAIQLPAAEERHFRDRAQYKAGSRQHLIEDDALLDALVEAGMAVLVDVHRGRQPKVRIIQLRPQLDAPPKPVRTVSREPAPTVEMLRDCIDAIYARERVLVTEIEAAHDAEIRSLRLAIAQADADLLDVAQQLRDRLASRVDARQEARRRAFAELSTDPFHGPLLRTMSPAVDTPSATGAGVEGSSEHMNDDDEREQRRDATQRLWDERLRRALTPGWQPTKVIAGRLEANHDTVKQRLRDLLKRGGVERLVTTQAKATTRSKRNRRRSGVKIALYRLPSAEASALE